MPRSRISVTAKILSRSFKPLLYSLVKHNCCASKRTRLPNPKGKKTVIVGTVKENEYWEKEVSWCYRGNAVQHEYQRNHRQIKRRVLKCRCSETNYGSNEEFNQSVSFLDKHKDIGTKKVEKWKRTQWLNQNNPRFTTQITQLSIPLGICLKKSRDSVSNAHGGTWPMTSNSDHSRKQHHLMGSTTMGTFR